MDRKLNIGILGTRGVPNQYGGFEQCAQYLSEALVKKGHRVVVYNSSNHPYQENTWNEVEIIHCKDPENKFGTAGQFIYDFNCIMNARKMNFDVVLHLGYTSNSIWYSLFPENAINIINMDGLEWKRSKYSTKVQRFLKLAEKLAAKHGDFLVADSIGIQQHLLKTYKKESTFIAYGAEIFQHPNKQILTNYNLRAYDYDMILARMEPENNIETIIKGFLKTSCNRKLIVVGTTTNNFGTFLKETYHDNRLMFLGAIYDIEIINNLRFFSALYFHGHSVGGTNPSLLEAMSSNALLVAHDNIFNKSILENNSFYFKTSEDITTIVNNFIDKKGYQHFIDNNLKLISEKYNWQKIADEYENLFINVIAKKK
jgi:glycosyltransferase involved in cell wall biosynthesis